MPETLQLHTDGAVGWISLDRPSALNALSSTVMDELLAAAQAYDDDPAIGCVVVTGSAKAFAAGADVAEMQPLSYADVYTRDLFAPWDALTRVRTPVVAAVAGYALGGGCELAMMCDLILAADTARFGQPEITLGTIPGMGGSQRLTRAVGKSKAMDLCLTGRTMDAEEAERAGLVARVLPADELLAGAQEVAAKIASMSRLTSVMVTEAVDAAYETTLSEGVRRERRLFQATFATDDQTEGMAAFLDKRPPTFTGR